MTSPINLRRADAGRYLKERWGVPCSGKTLAKMACLKSDGPVMVYAGRFPLYPVDGLDAYAKSRLSHPVRSTSERDASGLETR
jgi:hypothetical protein